MQVFFFDVLPNLEERALVLEVSRHRGRRLYHQAQAQTTKHIQGGNKNMAVNIGPCVMSYAYCTNTALIRMNGERK